MLYTAKTFNDFMDGETPEILRSNLVKTVLTLKRLGVDDLTFFEYIGPPCTRMLLRALTDLFHMGAVDDQDGGESTLFGNDMTDAEGCGSQSEMPKYETEGEHLNLS
ncbi:hypothetical protein YC2023_029829 [Brassica napus]